MKSKLIIILSLLALVFPLGVFARSVTPPRIVTLPAGTTHTGNYFAAGEVVQLDGTVEGDAYVAGAQVIVNGTVTGDLLVAGGQVTFAGSVGHDLRAAGGQVTIGGQIKGNATAVGGNIEILKNTALSGSLVVAGGNVTVSAPVPSSLTAASGRLSVSSDIGGSVTAVVDQLYLSPDSLVQGNLTYYSENPADISSATVSGTVSHEPLPGRKFKAPEVNPASVAKAFGAIAFVLTTIKFITLFVLGALAIRFFPGYFSSTGDTISARPWASAGYGFLWLVATPAVFFILLITVVGIPTAFIYLLVFGLAAYFAHLPASFWLGKLISTRLNFTPSPYLYLFIGLVVIFLLGLLGPLGLLIKFISVILGLGAYLLASGACYRQLRSKNLI